MSQILDSHTRLRERWWEMLSPAQLRLWEACEKADAEAVRACLADGASVSEKNRFGWNALHRACMGGSTDVVALVLPVDDGARLALLASADIEGNSPLHIAAGCAHAALINPLLRAGGAVDAPKATGDGPREEGALPMHTACKALAAAEEPERIARLFDTVSARATARPHLQPDNATALAGPRAHQRRGVARGARRKGADGGQLFAAAASPTVAAARIRSAKRCKATRRASRVRANAD
jgi:hypothetical protein